MKDNHPQPLKRISQSKVNHFSNQFDVIYNLFLKNPMTMKEASVLCNIDRANVCWHIRKMKQEKLIVSLGKTYCSITQYKALRWTTNRKLFPINNQLTLF